MVRPIVWIVGLLGGGVAYYLYTETKASAATPAALPAAAPAAPPLSPAITVNITPGTITPNPASGSEFSAATLAAAQLFDNKLLASGCSTTADATCAAFQQAYQADPAGGQLIGGIDGLYGPSTSVALGQVLGTTNITAPCVADAT